LFDWEKDGQEDFGIREVTEPNSLKRTRAGKDADRALCKPSQEPVKLDPIKHIKTVIKIERTTAKKIFERKKTSEQQQQPENGSK
jgi:hypothetical protein